MYRIMPSGDKWLIHEKNMKGWKIIAWYYEESSAREHIYELNQKAEDERQIQLAVRGG